MTRLKPISKWVNLLCWDKRRNTPFYLQFDHTSYALWKWKVVVWWCCKEVMVPPSTIKYHNLLIVQYPLRTLNFTHTNLCVPTQSTVKFVDQGKMRKWCCYVTFAIKDSTIFALALLWEVFQIRGGGVRHTRWHSKRLPRDVVTRCMVVILDMYFWHGTIFWQPNWRVPNVCETHKLFKSCVPDMLNPRSCLIGMNNRLG